MGSKNTTEKKKELLNDTNFQNVVKKATQVINDISVNVLQTSIVNHAQTTTVNQSVSLNNVKAKSLEIGPIDQDASVSIDVSVLSDTSVQQDIAAELTSELTQQLSSLSNSTQSQLNEQGEQIFATLLTELGDTLQGIGKAGETNTEQETVANLLNVVNDTTIENLIQESVSSEITNETVQNISTTLSANQDVNVSNADIDGDIVINAISQEVTLEAISKAVETSDLSSNIISSVASMDSTDITNVTTSSQEQEQKAASTLQDVGSVVGTIYDGIAGIIGAVASPMLIAAVVFGIVVLFAMFLAYKYMFGGDNHSNDESDDDGNDNDGSSVAGKWIWWIFVFIIIILIIIIIFYLAMKGSTKKSESSESEQKEGYGTDRDIDEARVMIADKWLTLDGELSNWPIMAGKFGINISHEHYIRIANPIKSTEHQVIGLRYLPCSNTFGFAPWNAKDGRFFVFTFSAYRDGYILHNSGKYIGDDLIGIDTVDHAAIVNVIK